MKNILISINFYPMVIFCIIPTCNDPSSHNTSYHQCEKCFKRGHSLKQCGFTNIIHSMILKNTSRYNIRLPDSLWCIYDAVCATPWSHTTTSHDLCKCTNHDDCYLNHTVYPDDAPPSYEEIGYPHPIHYSIYSHPSIGHYSSSGGGMQIV